MDDAITTFAGNGDGASLLSVTVSMAAVTIGIEGDVAREPRFNSTSLGSIGISWNEQDVVKGQAVHRYFYLQK